MGWLGFLLCCVLMAGAVPASASQDPPVRSDQEILVELERAWNEAFYRKDVAFIENRAEWNDALTDAMEGRTLPESVGANAAVEGGV